MADYLDMQQIFGAHGLLAQALPNYEERPQQVEMSQRIWEALHERQTLLVEAGTGTGKTLAYLIPAILSGLKVVVSTGTKNLQEQIFSKDIPFLHQVLPRSEEHTSELQSQSNLVCRLLLEKKKYKLINN